MSNLVYSTQIGAIKATKSKDSAEILPPNTVIKLRRSTAGRAGKTVIVLTDIPLPFDEIKALAQKLKKICGAGGSVKNRSIEIQGEHLPAILNELKKQGFKAKQIGD